MDIQKEWGLFVAHLRTLGVVKIGRNALGVITNLTREGNCSLGYNDIELMWETWQVKAQAVPEWISVEDRMPEEGEEVWVHHYGHIVQATKDKKYSGGFKQRNCRGWESVSCYISHWMSMSIKLPESYNFYYEHDAKVAQEKAIIEAQERSHD